MTYQLIIIGLAALSVILLILLLRPHQPVIPPDVAAKQEEYDELLALLQKHREEKQNLDVELVRLQEQNNGILRSIQENQDTLKHQEENFNSFAASYEARKAQEKQRYDNALAAMKADFEVKKILQSSAYEEDIQKLTNEWENERSRYMAAIQVVQSVITEDEDAAQRHIHISESDKDDISYLMNTVVGHLSHPDVLYKLIWTEFVQRPTNEMLNYVLPQKDCAGIYKITNDRNKKAYIGRSTSVRKRLTDHIKSAVGISTIADQRIHQVMREEGLWNFTFELIEECDKEQLNEREKFYISTLQTEQLGYNQKAGG